MNAYWKTVSKFGLPAAVALTLSACGGGGSSVDAAVSTPVQGVINGVATKGPMNHANVTAYGVSGGQMGAQIGMANTDANGNFSMNIGSYAGPVLMQVSGGSYTDEATGSVMPLASGDVMTAILSSIKAGTTNNGIQVTPVTAMAQSMARNMVGGMTDANIAAANTAMGNNFSVSDILHTAPMNPLLAGSGAAASQDAQNYGMTLAAMTKYAQTQGMSSSSAMVTALMNDAADGVLDGKAGTLPVQMGGMAGGVALPASAATSGMGSAMGAFMGSAQNKSGVSTTTLMNKLIGSTAQAPSTPASGTPAPVKNATVSGTAFNGVVTAGTMMAFALNNGVVGAQIASTALDAQGNFTLQMGSYSGGVMLQMSGASYIDEATKTTMTMAAKDVMSAVLPTLASGANVSGIWVTPVTSMAQTRAQAMSSGMTDANIAAANTAMGNYFSVSDILRTQPINPSVAGAGAVASTDARNYGMTLAAMSQSAKALSMTSSSTLVTAMMNDAADGLMNGKTGTNPVSMTMGAAMGQGAMASTAGTSGLASAMTNFMNSSANASGLTVTDMTSLMQKLINANGTI